MVRRYQKSHPRGTSDKPLCEYNGKKISKFPCTMVGRYQNSHPHGTARHRPGTGPAPAGTGRHRPAPAGHRHRPATGCTFHRRTARHRPAPAGTGPYMHYMHTCIHAHMHTYIHTCRASHTGDAIRVIVGSVSVGVVHRARRAH